MGFLTKHKNKNKNKTKTEYGRKSKMGMIK